MDTIEEEIDNIPYIDETDDEVIESVHEANPKKKRLVESLDKNYKEFKIQEQRQKQHKTTHLSQRQQLTVDAQTEHDLSILQSLIQSNKQRSDLQELRDDRILPLNASDVNVIKHKPVSVRPVYSKMIREQDNSNMKGDSLDGKKYDPAENDRISEDGKADNPDGVKLKLVEDSHDKMHLIDNDWNSEAKTPTRQHNIHDQSEKENIESFSRLPNDNAINIAHSTENANNSTQHGGMNKGFMEMQEPDFDSYNGAKPKMYTKRVNGHDMQLKELKLQHYDYHADTENLIQKEKGKGKSHKRKNKSKHDLSEQCLKNSGSDIKIFVTDEEGTETEALVSESTTETSMNTLNRHHTLSTVTSPSFETISPDESSKSSGAINYLRKMSEDNEKKGNSLLKQQELYNLQKAKPFQKFSKVKTGMFEVGIEGDEKRSHIKSIIITPGTQLLMFDRNNKSIKMFDRNLNPLDVLPIGTKYCRLTPISIDTFAASLPEKKKISIFKISNMNKLSVDRSLPHEQEYFGITHFEGKIYVTQRRRATNLTESDKWEIQMIDMNENEDEVKTIRTFSPGHKDCTLHANEQGIYLTNKVENEVLMLSHDGSFLYRHKVSISCECFMFLNPKLYHKQRIASL